MVYGPYLPGWGLRFPGRSLGVIKLISITSSVPSSTHERKFFGPLCSMNKPVINGIILSLGSSSRRQEEVRFLAGVSWVG